MLLRARIVIPLLSPLQSIKNGKPSETGDAMETVAPNLLIAIARCTSVDTGTSNDQGVVRRHLIKLGSPAHT